MPGIENYGVYNDRMRRSMWDKAFFMDKIPGADVLIDYGCADGSLIAFLQGLFPGMRFIGYDVDRSMIASAAGRGIENAWFFSETAEVLERLRALNADPSGVAVNFSSVFHEVFHYGYDLKAVGGFIRAVTPQYLVVRDMMYCSADPEASAPAEAVRLVRSGLPERQIRDFEKCWGPVSLRKNLVHLLLKYRYTENWERECAENYFSYSEDMLLRTLDPGGRYRCILRLRYILPWIRYDMENRFGIDPGDEFTTHFAMILSAGNRRNMVSLNLNAPSGIHRG